MKLSLHRVLRYEGSKPIPGAVLATFKGNQKKCTTAAKKWMQDNPRVETPMYVWS